MRTVPVTMAATRFYALFMRRLRAGQETLKDRSSRLQLMVFNAVLDFALFLTLLCMLLMAVTGDWVLLLMLPLPTFFLLLAVLFLARRRCFLRARVAFLFTCLLAVLYGVHLYGKETNLSLFCLHLALFPFLLFRTREWRLMILCSSAAFLVYEILELDLIPSGIRPLEPLTASLFRSIFTVGSFLCITLPALLLLWLSNQQIRRTLARKRIQALDEKMAAIGRLAAGAAHEINNPLAIIRLTLESLEPITVAHDPRGLRNRIQKAYDAIHRIHSILQKLLVSSHPTTDQPEALCVHSIAELIMERAQLHLQKHGIHLAVTIEIMEQAVIHCQRQHVLDAVDSLIHNALEALRGQEAPAVSLTLRSRDQVFQVEVEDSGPGVSDEALRSIFTPFFTTKEVGSGLGLSLYSARCMARQYGGDLTCDRGPGGRFCLSFPMHRRS